MIEFLTNWFHKKWLRDHHIKVDINDKSSNAEFKRVLNCLKENQVMVVTKDDGIYVRMAGTESEGECFSLEWGKVVSFELPENQ